MSGNSRESTLTAEVAIINRHGVALAADSAVTIGGGVKVFNSANKLFLLGEDESIGLMVYGNAQLMGVGWEAIVKMYREQLGDSPATLADCADDFLEYLRVLGLSLFSEDQQARHVESSAVVILDRILRWAEDSVLSRLRQGIDLTTIGWKRLLTQVVDRQYSAVASLPFLDSFDEATARRFERKYRRTVGELVDLVFKSFPMSNRARQRLVAVALNWLVRVVPDPAASGVVIAGFGKDDVFPRMRTYSISGVVMDTLRWHAGDAVDVDFDSSGQVHAFAQSQMVSMFMEGVHPDYREFSESYWHKAIASLPEALDGALGRSLKASDRKHVVKELQQLVHDVHAEATKELNNYRRESYVMPVVHTVGTMPKEEMAAMAHALVNLTSIKLRASLTEETVGGPVDVAVITKGDGFVWIERKHYFDPALNPRFIARHYRRGAAGEQSDEHS